MANMPTAQCKNAEQPLIFSTSPSTPTKHASTGLAKATVRLPHGLEKIGLPPGLEPMPGTEDNMETIEDHLSSRSTTGSSGSPKGSTGSADGDGEHSDATESNADQLSDPLSMEFSSLLSSMQSSAYDSYAYLEFLNQMKQFHLDAEALGPFEAMKQGWWHPSTMYSAMPVPVAHAKRFCHDCGGKRDVAYAFCPHCGLHFDSPA